MTGAHRLVYFLGFGTDEPQVNALGVQGERGVPTIAVSASLMRDISNPHGDVVVNLK